MGLKQSHGFRGRNYAPSLKASPKTNDRRESAASGLGLITTYDATLDDLSSVGAGYPTAKPSDAHPIPCPCCQQPMTITSPDVAAFQYGLCRMEARILAAVWKGKGLPVATERIFDAMYIDHPNGGPASGMYSSFKVKLCRLRKKLSGSGISIERVGQRGGYRLVLGER